MEQAKITIDKDCCTRCGHCGRYFKDLPELAFDHIIIPHWVYYDQHIMDHVREMVGHCETQAISLYT